MSRLTVFAKGNSDVADSLFACEDRSGRWGGVNEALRGRGSPWRVRMRHETLIRSDALLQADGEVPEALGALSLDWPYTHQSQFSAAFYEGAADVYVLSIQPDVTMKLVRHRASGRLFYPGAPAATPPELKVWLKAECELVPLLQPEQSLSSLRGVIARLRQRSAAPVLIYNLSSVIPGERLYSSVGIGEVLSTRIKRFNLALLELAGEAGVFVVDVDRVVACAGADRLKLDAVRLNVEGSRRVAEDVVELLISTGAVHA